MFWSSALDQRCQDPEEPQKPREQNVMQAAVAPEQDASPVVTCEYHLVSHGWEPSLKLAPSWRDSPTKCNPRCSSTVLRYHPLLNSHQEMRTSSECDRVLWQNVLLVPQMRTRTEPKLHVWISNQSYARGVRDELDAGAATPLWTPFGKAFGGDASAEAPGTRTTGERPGVQRANTGDRNPVPASQAGSSTVEAEAEKHRSGEASTHAHPSGSRRTTNTGVKSHRCRECGRAFVHQSFLRRHMDIHTGEQPYECERCGKAFRYSLHLHKHLRKHVACKGYRCRECGKGFPKSSELAAHGRTHGMEKPHACERCGKAFAKPSGLRRHLRTHR